MENIPRPNIHLLPVVRNPNMVDFFSAQLTNPFSEGLVIRSATQRNLGSYTACADNGFIMKCKMKGGEK